MPMPAMRLPAQRRSPAVRRPSLRPPHGGHSLARHAAGAEGLQHRGPGLPDAGGRCRDRPDAAAGSSPRAILAAGTRTLARVSGVPVRDGAAVAGHCGKALRFPEAAGQLVISSCHCDAQPGWRSSGSPGARRKAAAGGDLPVRRSRQPGIGASLRQLRTHLPASAGTRRRQLLHDAAAGKITGDFAGTLANRAGPGDDAATDFPGISFPASDSADHSPGASSLAPEVSLPRSDLARRRRRDTRRKPADSADTSRQVPVTPKQPTRGSRRGPAPKVRLIQDHPSLNPAGEVRACTRIPDWLDLR